MVEIFEGYVTKYALTSGIEKMTLETSGNGLAYRPHTSWKTYFYGEGKDWHRTWESAVSRAEKMREARLASLKKSAAKIIAIRFEQQS